MASLVGKTLLDRYNVQEFLGRGGMAEVYKVWDNHRMTYLAMKVLLEDLAVDKVFMRRFAREAKTLEKLQHPSIVRFYGLEREGRLAFMLMDYIEGDNLKPLIFDHGGALPNEQVSAIMRAIAGALSYAHRQGMVHCDIKSANIMLNKHGEAMLTDFGIARMTDAATATMVGAGTPAYMAPEQVKGLDPTPQSDLYSLGIVLYEMLTGGERPFTGETATITGSTSEKVRWEQLNAPPTPPSHWNAEISPELEAVILKCLQKDAKKRYQSALELINALELALGGKEAAERPQPKPVPVKNPPLPQGEGAGAVLSQSKEVREPKPTPPVPKPDRSSRPVRVLQSQKKWLPAAGIVLIAILFLGFGWLMGGGSSKVFPTKTPTPVLGVGSTMTSEKDGMVMVYVPEGEFLMGSEDGDSDEKPSHTVYLDAYWIDQSEITNAMYAKCVTAGACGEPKSSGSYSRDSYYGNADFDNYPVIYVSWEDAQTYCAWADRRLPSEAEWEKAAGWNENTQRQQPYPWGVEIDKTYANYGAKIGDTTAVGSYEKGKSFYGAYDMAGNVWEWVNDWYDGDYYANSSSSNPLGSETGSTKVLRGGSWYDYYFDLRAASRYWGYPVSRDDFVGFRCSLSLP